MLRRLLPSHVEHAADASIEHGARRQRESRICSRAACCPASRLGPFRSSQPPPTSDYLLAGVTGPRQRGTGRLTPQAVVCSGAETRGGAQSGCCPRGRRTRRRGRDRAGSAVDSRWLVRDRDPHLATRPQRAHRADGGRWRIVPKGPLVLAAGRPARVDDWTNIPGPPAARHRGTRLRPGCRCADHRRRCDLGSYRGLRRNCSVHVSSGTTVAKRSSVAAAFSPLITDITADSGR